MPASSSHSVQNRAVIIGCAVGGAALIGIIVAIFLFRRFHKRTKLAFLHREAAQPNPRALLLAGEDLDDPFSDNMQMQPYSDHATTAPPPPPPANNTLDTTRARAHNPSMSSHSTYSQASYTLNSHPSYVAPPPPPPHVMPMRAADSGSLFREGGVWPPPAPLVDPFKMHTSQADLSSIVEDVMGMPQPAAPGEERHSRANSETALLTHSPVQDLEPESPTEPPRASPLYVANADPDGEPTSPRNWLDRSPRHAS